MIIKAARTRTLAALAGFALILLSPAHAGAEPVTAYPVKRGDTLYGLASEFLVSPQSHREVARLNRVTEARRLPPGRVLQIPDRLLRTEPVIARLAAFRGPVTVIQGGAEVAAVADMPIGQGARILTGEAAFATLELPDGSRVSLPSRSRVRVEELRRVLLTGQVRRRFALEAGRSAITVSPDRPTDGFSITTPLTVSAVRGTVFRVSHDEATDRSTLEVIEGVVANAAASGDGEASVSEGFGRLTEPAGPGQLLPLLPAPQFVGAGRAQDEPDLTFTLRPMAEAAAYRIQIGADAGFIDVLTEATAPEPVVRLDGAAIPNGALFARATAIDGAGLEGLPAVVAFQRRLNSLDLGPPDAGGDRFLFRWADAGEGVARFRFQLARDADMTDLLVDEPGLEDRRIAVTNLPPGAYYWRVRVTRFEGGEAFEKWSKVERFQLGE